MSGTRRFAIVGALGLVVAVAAMVLGAWWLTFPVGLAIGVALPRARIAIPTGATIGLLAWSLPLAWAQATYGLASTSSSLAAIMGFGHQGLIPIVLTCALGLLLGLTGAWLGSAGRAVSISLSGRGA